MAIQINHIKDHPESIANLASAQFDLWGPLTSRDSLEEYEKLLHTSAFSDALPTTLIAVENSAVLGSVNVLESDLPLRRDLTPWLAQLFVFPNFRRRGVGASLVEAAIIETKQLGWHTIYLYTSGTLPNFYEQLGWSRLEEIVYQNKMRVVMAYETTP